MRYFLLIVCLACLGASKYVSPSGSNANLGTEGSPYLTIAYAITQLAGQDTLYLRGGTYTADWNLDGIPSGASWAAMTTIKNYLAELPIIRPSSTGDVFGFNLTTGSYICLEGFELDMANPTPGTAAGIKITSNANHVRITNCHIHHVFSAHGIVISPGGADNADDNQIYQNVIHHCGHLHDGGSDDHAIYCETRRNRIRGNIMYQNHSHALHLFGGTPDNNICDNNLMWSNLRGVGIYGVSNLVFNNVAWSNTYGFRAGSGSQVTHFLNNTAFRNARNFEASVGMQTSTFENCIAVEGSDINGGGFYLADSDFGVTVRYCLSVSNLVNNFNDPDGLAVTNNNKFGSGFDPGFVSALSTNFALLSSSAARNAGVAQTTFAIDLIGTARPQEAVWDIGAYEYLPGSATAIQAVNAFVGSIVQAP